MNSKIPKKLCEEYGEERLTSHLAAMYIKDWKQCTPTRNIRYVPLINGFKVKPRYHYSVQQAVEGLKEAILTVMDGFYPIGKGSPAVQVQANGRLWVFHSPNHTRDMKPGYCLPASVLNTLQCKILKQLIAKNMVTILRIENTCEERKIGEVDLTGLEIK